jgi:hypothetical protein
MRASRYGVPGLALAAVCILVAPGDATAQKKRDVITRDEIQQSAHKDLDLHRVVRSLRPHFLAPPRGQRTLGMAPPAPVALYVDGSRMGGLDGLQQISAADVDEVRYLEPARAQETYGITVSGGAVLVTMNKSRKAPQKP